MGSTTGLLTQLNVVRSGLVTVADGSAELSTTLTGIVAGSGELASGAARLRDGASLLHTGMESLERATLPLPGKVAVLAEAAEHVAVGSATLAEEGRKAVVLAESIISPESLAEAKVTLLADLEKAGLTTEQTSLVIEQFAPMITRAKGATDQIRSISSQLVILSAGAASLSSGVQQLSAEAPALLAGVARSASGAAALAAGTRQISSGSSDVASAIDKTSAAASTIRDALTRGVSKIPETDKGDRARRAETVARPIVVQSLALTSAGSLGAGLAPYFISLGAWIGIYALFLVIRPPRHSAGIATMRRVRNVLPGWFLASVLGAFQMALVLLVVVQTLKVRVDQPMETIGFMILASATFAAIMWSLNILLGRIGPFVGLGLMLVQLVTAGGTFPWQTLPGPLAFLHTALPMSASVEGLRQLMYGGSSAIAFSDAKQLACWLIGALVVAVIAFRRNTRSRQPEDLKPWVTEGRTITRVAAGELG